MKQFEFLKSYIFVYVGRHQLSLSNRKIATKHNAVHQFGSRQVRTKHGGDQAFKVPMKFEFQAHFKGKLNFGYFFVE